MVVNMKQRYFAVQHPTFGSYKKPIKHRVEGSLYYWWWYALTLNETYNELCEGRVRAGNAEESKLRSLFADFGDVRYEGCKYIAFCNWWTSRVATGEKRGEFLFAEKQSEKFTQLISNKDDFEKFYTDSEYLVIAVHKHSQKQYIEKSINRILSNNSEFRKGKLAFDIANSSARYKIHKPLTVQSVKKAFDCYTIKKDRVGLISNNEIAILAGLSVKSKAKDEITDKESLARTTSITVSRYIKLARELTNNVLQGKLC